MSRRRLGIYGATDESLRLVPLLADNPEIELAAIYVHDRDAALSLARSISPELAREIEAKLGDDVEHFAAASGGAQLDAIVDASPQTNFSLQYPEARERGVQVVTPLAARLLWGYGSAPRDRKSELLRALAEVVESVELTVDSHELFQRMLQIAVGVTGAEGGSLMLVDEGGQTLSVGVAIGIERELWSKIKVRFGEGIAGRVAADARPLLLHGKADRESFAIVRERLDVESALSVPLIQNGRVLGVLNLHHTTREGLFTQEDLEFMQELGRLDAQIIARAQEHESLRDQAARYSIVREVQAILASPDPLPDRLAALCRFAANRIGQGIASVYLCESGSDEMRLVATSLEGGGFGGEYRIVLGQGIDGRVAASREASLLHDDRGTLAYAALPLLAGDKLVGVMSLQAGASVAHGSAFEELLEEMASAVADGVAQAEREARMTANATRLNAINETGIRMLSANELSEVVRLATSSVAMILDAEHAVLRLQDEATRRYVIRSYFGPADGRQQEQLFRLDKHVSVEAIKRRQTLLSSSLEDDDRFPEQERRDTGFRSLLAGPIKRDGQVIGTVTVYDKVAADRFFAGNFGDEDLQVFGKFISYVERAVQNAQHRAQTRQQRNFDEETGLPNASYLRKRIKEEIARAHGRPGTLAIALCQIENLELIAQDAGAAHAHRIVMRTADALREQLRDFDVLGRSERGEFVALLPDPGPSPDERIYAIARAVGDTLAKEEGLNAPHRIALAFGYGVHPHDGEERDALLTRAREPRIRLV